MSHWAPRSTASSHSPPARRTCCRSTASTCVRQRRISRCSTERGDHDIVIATKEEEGMRWIRYEANGQRVYGILEGDMVTEVRGDPFAGYEKTMTRRPLSSVKLLVPVEPRTFYCAGLNYADHVIEAAKKRG